MYCAVSLCAVSHAAFGPAGQSSMKIGNMEVSVCNCAAQCAQDVALVGQDGVAACSKCEWPFP